MRVNKSAFLTGLLLLSASGLFAQPPARYISLQEAVGLGQQASGSLRVSEARLHQADAAYREAKDRRLPDFSISGSYLRLAQPDMELKLKLNSNNGSGESRTAAPAVTQAAYALANASVPLFSGFRIQSGIESARYLKEASRLDGEGDREEVIQQVISAYSDLFKANTAVKLVREGLRQSGQRVQELSNLEKNGLLARNDLLKAELQQSNIELSLLEAENNQHIANEHLALLLGLPTQTLIGTDSVFALQADDHSLPEWQLLALRNRKDAASLGYRAKAAEAGVRAAKGDYYPSLAVTGGYIGAYIENVVTIKDAVNAGVGLSYTPSSLWKAGTKVAAARARLAEVEASRGMLEDAIRLQTAQAYEQYLLHKKKIEVYGLASAQAAENYRIVRNKYDNNLATTTDLLDADVARLQAQLNHAISRADAIVSYQKLLRTAGLLTADNLFGSAR